MIKNIKHIGTLTGELLVFGGVYSNLQALEVLHQIAEQKKIPPERIICTGDVVAYCAQPEECVRFMQKWGVHCIAGNVEIQLREGLTDCGCDFNEDSRCDLFARQWYPYAQTKLSAASIDWMKSLPEFITFRYAGRQGLVLHGSDQRTAEYIFSSSSADRKQDVFIDNAVDLIIAGHCGLPFQQPFGQKVWFNPGVIGMPANDGTSRVWYGLLNEKGQELQTEIRAFEFDYDETFAQMLENELPIAYAQTLSSGRWDNNDILPPHETARQGIPLAEECKWWMVNDETDAETMFRS